MDLFSIPLPPSFNIRLYKNHLNFCGYQFHLIFLMFFLFLFFFFIEKLFTKYSNHYQVNIVNLTNVQPIAHLETILCCLFINPLELSIKFKNYLT